MLKGKKREPESIPYFLLGTLFIFFFSFLLFSQLIITLLGRDALMKEQWSTTLLEKGWNHQNQELEEISLDIDDKGKKTPIKIMIWTNPTISSSRMERLHGIRDTMNGQSCFEGCSLIVGRNQSEMEEADAVVFFMFTGGIERKDLPERKSSDQIWIYNQHEPPPNYSPGKHLDGLFNWTMTYRKDSDIYQPYFVKLPRRSHSDLQIYFGDDHVPLHKWIEGKSSLATAVISNCQTSSKRELILKKMQSSGIPIDIYGGCGNKTICKRYGQVCTDVWGDLSSKYKFFFAFENSLCSDYITEKFWRSLDLGMVPVVLGRGNYAEVAPQNSFIDMRDFSTPDRLKDYLQKLDRDQEEYSKYFEWRRDYYVRHNTDDFCKVCEKLREHKRKINNGANGKLGIDYSKVHNNLSGWWRAEPGHPGRPVCITPAEMGLGAFLD